MNHWLVMHLPYWPPTEWMLFYIQMYLGVEYATSVAIFALATGMLLHSLVRLFRDVCAETAEWLPPCKR